MGIITGLMHVSAVIVIHCVEKHCTMQNLSQLSPLLNREAETKLATNAFLGVCFIV